MTTGWSANWRPDDPCRLDDPVLREHFVERVYAHYRWRLLISEPVTVPALMAFHARHKLQLLAHSPQAYNALGRMAAAARQPQMERIAREYGGAFIAALRHPATRPRHVNVLQHAAGYFKRLLDVAGRQELGETIDRYQSGVSSLDEPVALLLGHARAHRVTYLLDQSYFAPYPDELKLRNHV